MPRCSASRSGFYDWLRREPAGKTEAFMERCDAAFAESATGSDGMPLAA